jgi:hypothetical protein
MGDLVACSLRHFYRSQPVPVLRMWTGRLGVCRLGVFGRNWFAESWASGLVMVQRPERSALGHCHALGDMDLVGVGILWPGPAFQP